MGPMLSFLLACTGPSTPSDPLSEPPASTRAPLPPPEPLCPVASLAGPRGDRVCVLLDAAYMGGSFDAEPLVRDLSGPDAEEAGLLIAAVLTQGLADEASGRAPWRASPYWGGSGRSVARSVLQQLVSRLEGAQGDAVLPIVRALLADPMADSQQAALSLLERTESVSSGALVAEIASSDANTSSTLLGGAARLCKRRALPCAGLERLAQHPDPGIREAARDALPSARAFSEIEALRIWLVPELERTAARIPRPQGSRWVVEGDLQGWASEDKERTLLDWHGIRYPLSTDPVPRDGTLGQAAEALIAARSLDQEKGARFRSSQGMLTGQFEPSGLYFPEILVSSWLHEQGDDTTAARLLVPAASALKDGRLLGWLAKNSAGTRLHNRMLNAWTNLDFAETARLAEHLSSPLFEGYGYQARATELAEQIRVRTGEEPLPTQEAWEAVKSSMSRAQQAEFLAGRVRQIRAIQYEQPGGVSYEEPQLTESGTPAINPYVELKVMRLTPDELIPLLPWLMDGSYLHAYSFWRDFHPERTLHRAGWVLADVFNDALAMNIVEPSVFERGTAAQRRAELDRIESMITPLRGLDTTGVLYEQLTRTSSFGDFSRALSEAGEDVDVLPILLSRERHFPDNIDDIVALVYFRRDTRAVPLAREWLGRELSQGSVLLAAAILLELGDPGDAPHVIEALTPLEADTPIARRMILADQLLLAKDPALRELLCAIPAPISRSDPDSLRELSLLQRQLLGDCGGAIEQLKRALGDEQLAGSVSGTRDGEPFQHDFINADFVAEVVASWKLDDTPYDRMEPPEKRAAQRRALAGWLSEQAQAVSRGESPQMRAPLSAKEVW